MPTYNVIRTNSGNQISPHNSATASPPMLNRNGRIDLSAQFATAAFAESMSARMPYLESGLGNLYVGGGTPTRLLEFRAVDWGKAATGTYTNDDLDFVLTNSEDDGVTYDAVFSGSVSDEDTTGLGVMVFYFVLEPDNKLKVNVNITGNTSADPLVNVLLSDLDFKWQVADTKFQTSSEGQTANKWLLNRWKVRGQTDLVADHVNWFGDWTTLFPSLTTVDKVVDVGNLPA